MQRHTADVVEIDNVLTPLVADAVITEREGILLGVAVADCVPILVYARKRRLIAAVHAGWRGTAAGIMKATLKKMLTRSEAEDIRIAIGPAIRRCCYHVGDDVLEAVIKETGQGDYHMESEGAKRLDLPSANRQQAVFMGIPPENIWMSDECTCCYPERFHSYRYSKNFAGRQGGFIRMI